MGYRRMSTSCVVLLGPPAARLSAARSWIFVRRSTRGTLLTDVWRLSAVGQCETPGRKSETKNRKGRKAHKAAKLSGESSRRKRTSEHKASPNERLRKVRLVVCKIPPARSIPHPKQATHRSDHAQGKCWHWWGALRGSFGEHSKCGILFPGT